MEFPVKPSSEITGYKKKYVYYIFIALGLLMPLAMLFSLWRYGVNIPFQDDWEFPRLVSMLKKGEMSSKVFFWAQHNEHKMIFPRMITYVFANLTDYNVLAQVYAGYILKVVSLFLLWDILKITFPGNGKKTYLAMAAAASLLLFSAVEVQNWIWGFTALSFRLAMFCAIATVWAIARWPGKWLGVLTALPAAFVATFSLGGFVILWGICLLAVTAYQWHDRKRIGGTVLVWLLAGLGACFHYFRGYQNPRGSLDPFGFIDDPLTFATYFFAYLGTPLGFWSGYEYAAFLGLLSIVGLGWTLYWFIKHSPHTMIRLIPWLIFIVFAGGIALLSALFRFKYGLAHATSSKYTTVTSMYWLGTLTIVAMALWRHSHQKPQTQTLLKRIAVGFAVIFLGINYFLSYDHGFQKLKETGQRLATALPYIYEYEVTPDVYLQRIYWREAYLLRERARALEFLKWGPFSKPPLQHRRLYAEPTASSKTKSIPLAYEKAVTQTFICRCRELGRIDFFISNKEGNPLPPLLVQLTDMDSEQPVYEHILSASGAENPAWRQLRLGPLPANGKSFGITVHSPGASSGPATGPSAVLWQSKTDVYPDGKMAVDGREGAADLIFRYTCAELEHGDTWLDLSPAMFKTVSWARFKIQGESRRVMLALPPSDIAWPMILPPQSKITLKTAAALDPRVWQKEPLSDGATFQVWIENENGESRPIFSRHVDPAHQNTDRTWLPVELDLSEYAGQSLTLRLATQAGPKGNRLHDRAGWLSPVIHVALP